MSKIEKINDLAELLKTGVINQEEFESLKKEIIHAPKDVEKPIEISEPQTKQEETPKQQPITTNINKPAQKLKWYERPWPVALLIIFFFPLGLLLMWVNKVWNVGTRLIITGLFVLGIYANVNDSQKDNKAINQSTVSNKVTFSEAKRFMEKRASNINQSVVDSKQKNFQGSTVYAFLTVTNSGAYCISLISEHQLSIIKSECGGNDKYIDWQLF